MSQIYSESAVHQAQHEETLEALFGKRRIAEEEKISQAVQRAKCNSIRELLKLAAGQVEFPKVGRVTLLGAATWLAFGSLVSPARWDQFVKSVRETVLGLGFAAKGVRNNDRDSGVDSSRPEISEALEVWQAEQVGLARELDNAVELLLTKARAGYLEVRGRQLGTAPRILTVDDLYLPISFDASHNRIVFDAKLAADLRSGYTAADVPGWSDVTVLAEQIFELSNHWREAANQGDVEPGGDYPEIDTKERRSLLRVIAALVRLARADISKPHALAAAVAACSKELGVPVSENTAAKYLKEASQAASSR